jgi:hypothetical protein
MRRQRERKSWMFAAMPARRERFALHHGHLFPTFCQIRDLLDGKLNSMHETATSSHRQQQLYWNQMVELKVAAGYIRRYRDDVGKRVTALGTLKAIASSGGIAAWAIWRDYAFLWGAIIAASQLADALKDVFPFTKIHKAASEHAISLNSMFIDAQLEWENIFSGRYTDEQIMNRRHKLMKLQHEAERKNFPHGLTEKELYVVEAEREAQQYFSATYGVKIVVGVSDG